MGGSIGGRVRGELLGRGTLCVQSKFVCLYGCGGHNILWQLVSVWDYSFAERLVGDDESYTAGGESSKYDFEAQCGWGSKDCVTWKVEEAVHNFVHADKVPTDSSTD